MTVKDYLYALAVGIVVALALIATAAKAACPPDPDAAKSIELTAIPNDAQVDARRGRVLLTVLHDASGRLDGAEFYAGRYIFNQTSGPTGRPIIVTDLSNPVAPVQLGRGIDIARVDGEIVNS